MAEAACSDPTWVDADAFAPTLATSEFTGHPTDDPTADHFLRPLCRRMQDRPGPPRALGPYRLLAPIGSGGTAAVWRAERVDDPQAGPVAVKLPWSWVDPAQALARCQRERRLLGALAHAHIVALRDVDRIDPQAPFLVMEHIEGRSLMDHVLAQRLSLSSRLRLALPLLHAVDHLHARGIVHRDLKPANILVTATGRVCLIDFGIAEWLARPQRDAADLDARALTPCYAAPEQLQGDVATVQTDVYALGVVLYELFAGVRPYALAPADRGALAQAVCEAQVAPLGAHLPHGAEGAGSVVDRLDAVVRRAMNPVPQWRHASAGQLARELNAVLAAAEGAPGRGGRDGARPAGAPADPIT